MRNEQGFLLVELLCATSVLTIALSALVVVFVTGLLTVRRASQVTFAAILADNQMESYRLMTSKDIGIDTSSGTITALDSTYKNDASCANSSTGKSCSVDGVPATETGPTGATPDTCATINAWYPNTLPCMPSRIVSPTSTPAGPDGRTYRVDTYIVQLAAVGTGTLQRTRKQVTVVVRDGSLNQLMRETSIFDCATGVTPGSTDC